MTAQKSVAELVIAARKLEAGAPRLPDVVLTEVRSAGYDVRTLPDAPGVYRFGAPLGLHGGRMQNMGMLVVREGTITYAEWNGKVFPQWAGWTQDENDASIRALLLMIRDDRR